MTGGGLGDITAVGDVTTGAAFSETADDDGNSLFFDGVTGDEYEVELFKSALPKLEEDFQKGVNFAHS